MFPKVLLVCGFNQRTANGITIANLFKQWPASSIALIEYHSDIEEIYVSNINNYYLLGNKESQMQWPFNLIRNSRNSCSLKLDSFERNISKKTNKNIDSAIFKNFQVGISMLLALKLFLLRVTGLVYISKKYTISKELNDWLNDFNPDIIYGTVEDIEKMNFLVQLKGKFNKKLVIHVFDDWINSGHRYLFLKKYWNKRIKNSFSLLLGKSDIRFTISEKMATEYFQKYNLSFSAFHNPIDKTMWFTAKSQSIEKNENKIFTFVYAGKVNVDTIEPILDFIKAIKQLNQKDFKVVFEIYSPYDERIIKQHLGQYSKLYYQGCANYDDLPKIFEAADGLLLPLAFNKQTIEYIRLSMLTKVTEYMISGTPIFLFAPENIAVTEYLCNHNAAYIHSNKLNLENAISHFISDSKLRNKLSENALNLALTKHTIEQVSERLIKVLNN